MHYYLYILRCCLFNFRCYLFNFRCYLFNSRCYGCGGNTGVLCQDTLELNAEDSKVSLHITYFYKKIDIDRWNTNLVVIYTHLMAAECWTNQNFLSVILPLWSGNSKKRWGLLYWVLFYDCRFRETDDQFINHFQVLKLRVLLTMFTRTAVLLYSKFIINFNLW